MREDKTDNRLSLWIRSVIFFPLSAISITLYSGFVALLWIFFPLKVRHAAIRVFIIYYMWLLKVICRIDYKIEGIENLPRDSVGIVFCKHQSAWETFFLPQIFHDPAVIAKRELMWIPFFGWGLAAADPIVINRKARSSAMQQIITKGSACLAAGRWVVVFPEGTRVPYGQIGNYRLGGARLAAASGYPVVPVAHDAGLHWPRRGFIKYPGTIHMVIGKPIESAGRTPEAILSDAKTWIEDTMRRLESGIHKSTR